jgi:hypothetical protein
MPTENLTPYQILQKIYSEEGYTHGAASIRVKGFCNIKLYPCEDNLFCVKFEESKPIIQIGKTISVKTTVSGLKLGQNGGTIEVDNFPDVPFFYSWVMGDDNELTIDVTSQQSVGFDRKDLVEIFSRAAAQKLINSLIDVVIDSVVSQTEKSDE